MPSPSLSPTMAACPPQQQYLVAGKAWAGKPKRCLRWVITLLPEWWERKACNRVCQAACRDSHDTCRQLQLLHQQLQLLVQQQRLRLAAVLWCSQHQYRRCHTSPPSVTSTAGTMTCRMASTSRGCSSRRAARPVGGGAMTSGAGVTT